MKIICTQENLHKGLNIVSNIADKNTNLPILNNVLLKASKDGLELITTDLEIGIKVFVRGKVIEEGEFTVEAKLLNSFVSLLPKENIEINLKGDNLEITSKDQKTTIKGLKAEDFPLIPETEKEFEIKTSTNNFKNSLSQVVFSASLDTSRVEINAVDFIFKNNELILTATDSYRLAEKKLNISNNKEKDLVIPLKTTQEVLRILNEQDSQDVKIYFNDNQIVFTFNGVELISRIIDGKYPDYKQIIPNDFTTTVKCNVNDLIPVVKRVSLLCKQGINDVFLSFNKEEQKIIVSTTSSNKGDSTTSVSADIQGDNNDAIFNYRYLLDGLNNIKENSVIFSVNNSSSPALLKPGSSKDYIYLIMPIKQ